MKILNNLKKIAIILPLVLVFFTISCADDDEPTRSFDITQLEARISEAENLIATSIEGTSAGDFQPGSKQSLQDVLNWIYKRIESSKSQADIDDAGIKIDAAIDKFNVSIVEVALPWVQQAQTGTAISISDNIKPVLAGAFTLQAKFYIVDLNPKEFSGNLFATLDGSALGFSVRYFADGSFQIVTGNGGFGVATSAVGLLKSGEWLDIAYTNSGSEQKVYINGVEALSYVYPHVLGDSDLWIGNSPTWQDRMGNLLVQEFTAWNTVLDQATIQANSTATFDGTEVGLEAYFPFGSDLGRSFADVTGNYTATLSGDVVWVTEPPIILLDYTNLDAAIQEMTDFRATIVEGDMDGDYPMGTLDYIDSLIANANDTRENEGRQAVLDSTADSIGDAIALINDNLVAPAEGVYVDRDNPSAVGFRITPNYTPQGNYTVEFDLKLKTLQMGGSGEIFGNGSFGLRVFGYTEPTEEEILAAGGLWNFTLIGGYIGPEAPALSVRSQVWQHVAIVHDNSAMTTSIYIDGEMVGQSTEIGVPDVSGWGEIWLGNSWGAKMNGSIKDFRIWDEARSVGQFDADIDGTEANLQIYFPLDRVKGVQFSDETGNYNGEMRGIEWNK